MRTPSPPGTPGCRLFRLARPEAATKYLGLVVAARFQPSTFSSQLLNKHRQHAFDFGGLLLQLLIVIGLDQFQISTQEKFQATAAPADSQETSAPKKLVRKPDLVPIIMLSEALQEHPTKI